jgi:protein SCO1/2
MGAFRHRADGTTDDDKMEALLKTVRLDQKLNGQVPTDVKFRDETGKEVQLADYLGNKPVALMLLQLRCTMLCTQQLTVLTDSLKEMNFTPGKEFNLLIVSIDPREGPEIAAEKRKAYLEEYGRPDAAAGYHFLTGSKESIQRLSDSVGFHFVYDDRTDQYAHKDGVILLTPEGKIARYFFALNYRPRDLTFGLMEAAKNHIGSPIDYIALLCFHYNPTTGKYGVAILNVVRLAGGVTVALMALGVVVMRRRDTRSKRGPGGPALAGGGTG